MTAATPLAGAVLLESVEGIIAGIRSRDWIDAGLSGVATGFDCWAFAIDPLGQSLAAGVGWLIAHVPALNEPLTFLTGNAAALQAHQAQWGRAAARLQAQDRFLNDHAAVLARRWTGAGADAFQRKIARMRAAVRFHARAATAISVALGAGALVVHAGHLMVRDAIAQLAGGGLATVIKSLASGGILAAPAMLQLGNSIRSVAVKIGALVTKVGASITRLITRYLKPLRRLIDESDIELGNAPSQPSASPRTLVGADDARTALIQRNIRRSNPRYNPMNMETSNNCTNAVVAYDLRMRGLNVEARTLDEGTGRKQSELERLYGGTFIRAKDVASNIPDAVDRIHAIVESAGPGARGFLAAQYLAPVYENGKVVGHQKLGHVLVTENVGDQVYIVEPQARRMGPWRIGDTANLVNIGWMRTDNLQVGPQAFDFVQTAK